MLRKMTSFEGRRKIKSVEQGGGEGGGVGPSPRLRLGDDDKSLLPRRPERMLNMAGVGLEA